MNPKERKQKIRAWFQDKHNLIFLAILLAAFLIRFIFFLKTSGQPVWWDEGEYLSMAKSFAFDIPFNFNPQRAPLFPAVAAFVMLLGLGEAALRFITVLLPSLGLVLLAYLFGSALYNKKVGLIFAFLNAIFWIALFNTTRIHTDPLAWFFGMLTLYLFWRFYVQETKLKYLWLLGVVFALGFSTRNQNALLGVSIILYLCITEQYKWLLKKELWLTFLAFLIALSPLVAWNMNQFGKPIAQTAGYVSEQSLAEKAHYPIAWNVWNIFREYLLPSNGKLGVLFLLFFLLGILTFLNFMLGLDLVVKNKDKQLNADLFIWLLFWVTMLYFMFIERPSVYGYDPKWLIFAGWAIFLIIAKGGLQLQEWLKEYSKSLSFLVIAALLIVAAIPQITATSSLVNEKLNSYQEVKDAALWLKEHSSPSEVIYTQSPTQTTYYADRHSRGIPGTYEEFRSQQAQDHARFFTVSIFEKHPDWAYTYPQQHPDEFIPVQAYMLQENQPALVIYQYVPKPLPPENTTA